jgi:hypothetical protein
LAPPGRRRAARGSDGLRESIVRPLQQGAQEPSISHFGSRMRCRACDGDRDRLGAAHAGQVRAPCDRASARYDSPRPSATQQRGGPPSRSAAHRGGHRGHAHCRRPSRGSSASGSDRESGRRAVLVRRAKGGKRREVGMDRRAWDQFDPWLRPDRRLRKAAPRGGSGAGQPVSRDAASGRTILLDSPLTTLAAGLGRRVPGGL